MRSDGRGVKPSTRLLLAAGAILLALVLICGSSAKAQCAGDCNGDSEVTADELITGIDIALGNAQVDACPEFDEDGDGQCSVNELAAGVRNALDGCAPIVGELTFDKISMAVFPGATDTLRVTAKGENGQPDDWTVTSSNDGIVTVLKLGGNSVQITGGDLGTARITVTTNSGRRRSVPVRVYDPTVLDAGEILLKYVDTFTCRWDDAHSGAYLNGSFYQPVVPVGWHALGSHGEGGYGCPNIDGQAWMIVVKEDAADADPIHPPLTPPTDYTLEWNDAGTGSSVKYGSFWTPVCLNGYVAMGTVVTSNRSKPSLNEVTCVRRDLTTDAEAGSIIWDDHGTGSGVAYQGSFQLVAPNNDSYQNTNAYLGTGTFVTQGQLSGACSGENCWVPPARGGREVMNVLKLELPTLIDATPGTTLPSLTSCEDPPDFTEPIVEKVLLVPFTAILSGDTYNSRGLDWMVNNSPFVRVGREVTWEKKVFAINSGDQVNHWEKTLHMGVTTADSETFSHTVGVSITAKGGAEFLGAGGEVSATVSYQFGYETQHSVGVFMAEDTTVGGDYGPGEAVAVWQKHSEINVKLHNPQTMTLEGVANLPMGDSLSFVSDTYPNCSP
jgi:Vacuolar protein sorting-associated protein 62/Insecticidal Crystal Toxin, P42